MIYLPILDNFNTQMEYLDWLKEKIGEPSQQTWFWATHQMDFDHTKNYNRCAIVFANEHDAIAFRLTFPNDGT